VYSVEWSPSPNLEGDRGLSDADVDEFDKAPEEHEVTVSYALQRWFVDGNGDAQDAAGYGMTRDSDQLLPATITVVDREDKGQLAADSTLNGGTALASRLYTVGIGGKVSDVSVTVDPSDQQPVMVEVTYQFEYVRRHQIDQPASSDTLDVVSSDSSDTSQTVVIEDEGAGTSESVNLSGTTTVTTTASFSDVDAIYVTDGSGNPTDTIGTVTVSATSSGNTVTEIEGSNTYAGVEGAHGVPALGSGSHATAIGSSYYRTLQDEITLGGSSTYWLEINSKELSVDNNLNTRMRDDSFRQVIEEGVRDTQLTATVYGETESYSDLKRSLTNNGADIVWTFQSGDTVTLSDAKLVEPGSVSHEAEQTQMTLDNTFEPQGGGTAGLSIA